jgi:hypothetical protein
MLRENSKFSLTPFCKRQGITVTNMINPQFFPFDVDNFNLLFFPMDGPSNF